MSPDDDENLVNRCRKGESSAVREFVERFQRPIFSVCFRWLGQREDAEDVMQTVFLRAFSYLHKWDSSRPLTPWVLTIAVNRCRTHLAKRKSRLAEEGELASLAAPPAPCGDDGLAEELERALGLLREEYREAFILFHQSELPIEEVAKILECPTGTIKTWLYRARRELAEILRKRGVTGVLEGEPR